MYFVPHLLPEDLLPLMDLLLIFSTLLLLFFLMNSSFFNGVFLVILIIYSLVDESLVGAVMLAWVASMLSVVGPGLGAMIDYSLVAY